MTGTGGDSHPDGRGHLLAAVRRLPVAVLGTARDGSARGAPAVRRHPRRAFPWADGEKASHLPCKQEFRFRDPVGPPRDGPGRLSPGSLAQVGERPVEPRMVLVRPEEEPRRRGRTGSQPASTQQGGVRFSIHWFSIHCSSPLFLAMEGPADRRRRPQFRKLPAPSGACGFDPRLLRHTVHARRVGHRPFWFRHATT
jgi:hypothetical protein